MTIRLSSPFLPPIDEFTEKLEDIWSSKQLTNFGPLHKALEVDLSNYLNVEHVSLFCNGTSALIATLACSEISGEVITTPFSFIATANAILAANLTPVFADIDKANYNLDPKTVEKLITEKTSAILPVHTFGHSCKTDAFDLLAKKYNLKLFYDAAHSFGADCHCGSLFQHGNASVLSFHATKVFHTFEGGAVCTNDIALKKKLDSYSNFALGDTLNQTNAIGTNFKLNEIQAAMGLVQLNHINKLIDKRRTLFKFYIEKFKGIKGIILPTHIEIQKSNGSYFPILITDEFGISRDKVYQILHDTGVISKKYFYPALHKFKHLRNYKKASDNLKISEQVSNQILCLPIHPDLTKQEILQIINIFRGLS